MAIVAGRPCEGRFRLARTPRLGRHPAEPHPGRRDRAPVRRDDDGDGDQREFVGSPVAHLAVELPPRRRGRQDHARDHLARLEHGLDVRRLARQPVEVADRDAAGRSVGAEQLDLRVQHRHRDGHVGGMDGDARVARAEDRVNPVEAADRRAAGAGGPLVAARGRVVEVGAARALQQIAADRRLVAQLTRGARDQGLGEHRVASPNTGIRSRVGVGRLCPILSPAHDDRVTSRIVAAAGFATGSRYGRDNLGRDRRARDLERARPTLPGGTDRLRPDPPAWRGRRIEVPAR